MIVGFTDQALRELEEIGDYIACDDPWRAETFVGELIDKCFDLARFPEAFPLVPRQARKGIRKRSYRRYLIFYRLAGDRIEIIHVLHGSRDFDALIRE